MDNNLDEMKFNVTLKDAAGEERSFTSVKSFLQIIEQEQNNWNIIVNEYPKIPTISNIRNGFNGVHKYINDILKNHNNFNDEAVFNTIKSNINKMGINLIFSDTPFAQTLLDASNLGAEQASIFWDYVIKHDKGFGGMTFKAFEGAILGYEYMHQDDPSTTRRRDIEKKSFANLRKSLTDETDKVIGEADSLMKKITSDFNTFGQEIEKWRLDTQNDTTKQCDDYRQSYDQSFMDATARTKELETLYTEKLRLEKPAEYWHKRAVNFRKAGCWWGAALVITTLLSAWLFVSLFGQLMESTKEIEKLSTQHWQGIIVLVAILSLVAFLIRTFGKLTFSSFHLQRDAEEREQLSYFYLALAKDTEIDPESRRIVLQSLFSRSETGLLSGDHGPTMPGISELISKKIGN